MRSLQCTKMRSNSNSSRALTANRGNVVSVHEVHGSARASDAAVTYNELKVVAAAAAATATTALQQQQQQHRTRFLYDELSVSFSVLFSSSYGEVVYDVRFSFCFFIISLFICLSISTYFCTFHPRLAVVCMFSVFMYKYIIFIPR